MRHQMAERHDRSCFLRCIEDAFEDFQVVVHKQHARTFDTTTLADVRSVARDVENRQALDQQLCNLRRLGELLDNLDVFAQLMPITSEEDRHIAWIWVRNTGKADHSTLS